MTTITNRGTHFMKLREWIPLNKMKWKPLSQNPSAIHLLEQNLDKVNKVGWYGLSTNPNTIHILEKNLDKVDKAYLSQNPNAIHILEKNLDKVYWRWFSSNPNIFTYDYNAMKDRMFRGGIKEDLMKDRFHPRNLDKFKGWGFEAYDDGDE